MDEMEEDDVVVGGGGGGGEDDLAMGPPHLAESPTAALILIRYVHFSQT